jgi:hypothetical protein
MYAALLDIPDWFGKRYGQLHVFELENGTGLMLDANGMADIKVPEPAPVAPQFSVNTDDIEEARAVRRSSGSLLYSVSSATCTCRTSTAEMWTAMC